MLLAVDAGNTNVTVGIFDAERLAATWRLASDQARTTDEYAVLLFGLLARHAIAEGRVDAAVIASVVPPLIPTLVELCQQYLGITPTVVGTGVRTGIRVLAENPREVGADRVANAVATHRLYGGPAIVIDFGTATTFDAISAEGDYLGGAIAPGLTISANALYEHTARLYRVELVRPRQAIGRNTSTAIQSGLLFGYVGLIEGIVRRMVAELPGEPRIVATGGIAPVIARETECIETINPDLTLVGLRLIHELNTV